MERLRAFSQNDIPQIATLHQKVFGHGGNSPRAGLESYINKVFVQNPCRDEKLPSLVCEKDNREIVGFLGVLPRHMNVAGKRLRVAVSTQLMVEPNSRSMLAGVKLMQAYFSGPQDISMTDGANESTRRIWKTLGGEEIPSYSIYWTRTLRPVRYAVDTIGKTQWLLEGMTRLSRPFSWMVDSIVARIHQDRFDRTALSFSEEELDSKTLLDNLPRLSRMSLIRPEYDETLLKWLLELAEHKKKYGPLMRRMLRNAQGEIEGWYLYYLNVGGVSQVLQLAWSPQSFGAVLDSLFYSAWSRGSAAISGRLEPQYLHEFSHRHCRFSAGSAVLVKARDHGVLHAISTGNAYFSRLEGEWWNCFNEFI